jgi:hypothetical protein
VVIHHPYPQPGRACSAVIPDTRPPPFAALQSGHSQITALQQLCSSSLLRLLGEGLAQFLLLLLWEVGGDDLEVILLQLVDHPLGGVGPASQGKQRGGICLRGHDPFDGEEVGPCLRISKQFQKVCSRKLAKDSS